MKRGKIIRGKVVYARLLRLLHDEPRSARKAGEALGIARDYATDYLAALRRLGRVHICSWEMLPHARPMPVFAYGPGEDAPRPARRQSGRRAKAAALALGRRNPAELVAFEMLLRAIEDTPLSVTEAAIDAGLDRAATARLFGAMRKLRMVYVAAWFSRPDGGAPIECYQLGFDQRDARRPKPPGRRERNRRYSEACAQRRTQLQLQRAIAGNASVFTLPEQA